MSKLHILAIAAHPDDVELSCSGTLIKHVNMGQNVGIIDLTKGELGTRGTPELRLIEAQSAAQKMGISTRLNLAMADGFFVNDRNHQMLLIPYLRYFQPDIVITNSLNDRHPDHGRAGRLVADACFMSGLSKIETNWQEKKQAAWRPKRVFHMIQDRILEPSFVVDITNYKEQKIEAIKCFKSQFHNPQSNEPISYIATSDFLEMIIAKDKIMGKKIGVSAGEGYICEYNIGIDNLDSLLLPELP